ncbi:hypothetical protein ACFFX0_09435 [Citricoccus parietis]|uniref:Uncharacterized protein n=1 Tax=Citricoccus parietis TaxID=592307 RepID=A0ABV5FXJ4_9MICC
MRAGAGWGRVLRGGAVRLPLRARLRVAELACLDRWRTHNMGGITAAEGDDAGRAGGALRLRCRGRRRSRRGSRWSCAAPGRWP